MDSELLAGWSSWWIVGLAFACSAVATPILRGCARRFGFLDRPGPRSSHSEVTPRGGGLAIVFGASIAMILAGPTTSPRAGHVALLAGAALLAAAGLWDDRAGLPVRVKLAAQLTSALVVVTACGGLERLPLPHPLDLPLGVAAAPAAVLWLLVVTNAYNFMDGIDGIAGLQGAITGLGLGLVLTDDRAAAIALAIAGGCCGFLLQNWAPASIFMGDIGSSVLGYTFAALPLLLPPGAREQCTLFLILSLWLFLADVVWTRLKRLARGGEWYAAHREHVYQRLIDTGLSHSQVALAVGGGSAVLTVAGLIYPQVPGSGWLALALAGLLFGAELWWTRSRENCR